MNANIKRALDRLEASKVIMNGQSVAAVELAMLEATEAQALATVALAEQQRIANLISLMQMQAEVDGTTEAISGEALHALIEFIRTPATPFSDPDDHPIIRPEIAEALGIQQNRNNS